MTESGRCIYVLPKKGRRCRMLVKKGKEYCGEHAVHDVNDQERILCPNDPKHTVRKARLVQHLSKCNARIPDDPWIVKGLNSTEVDYVEITNTSHEDILSESLLMRIRSAYEEVKDEVCNWVGCGSNIYSDLMEPLAAPVSEARRKQLLQHSSIIGCAIKAGLLENDSNLCIVDFGSGKAELPYWISKKCESCSFLLLDNQGMRNKYDNRRLKENPHIRMERVRCPIEHLDLSRIKAIQEAKKVVGVCKHLCGRATDWCIKCIENSVNNEVNVFGFALAPCCHHKSVYSEYVGKSFLTSKGFVTEQDFLLLKYVASWAVCGILCAQDQKGVCEKHLTVDNDYHENAVAELYNLTREEKQTLGKQAKVLLELGRARYVEQLGYDVKLCQYVDYGVSPENLLIVGKKGFA